MSKQFQFKKSVLAHSLQLLFGLHDINKKIYTGIFVSVISSWAWSEDRLEITTQVTPVTDIQQQTDALAAQTDQLLKQQLDPQNNLAEFTPIQFDDLEKLPETPVDQTMADEIFRVAEEAKQQATQINVALEQSKAISVNDASSEELQVIHTAPVDVDQLMQSIQADSNINVTVNQAEKTLPDLKTESLEPENAKLSFYQRIKNKINPIRPASESQIPRISAEVNGAPDDLKRNIAAKLSSFTQESFADFKSSLPQLREMTNQAAQALGYYNAEFVFTRLSDSKVQVDVNPHKPVYIDQNNIDFTGPGANQPQFLLMKVVPEQDSGDIFNHGLYETTKQKITAAGQENGYFDSYWRLHDVKVSLPEQTADINLKYETGERYKLGDIEFRMSDPSKPLPLRKELLRKMAPWKDGDDYTFWRVNDLANNLTNSRYFNFTVVDAVKPDPINKTLELPQDIQKLLDEQNADAVQQQTPLTVTANNNKTPTVVKQDVVEETEFAGTDEEVAAGTNLSDLSAEQVQQAAETKRLQHQARTEKKVPVIVTLNADKINNLETGIGFGTDTGARLRTQYRRAIVNDRGHSWDANLEVSQIRQSIDTRYSIPYKHPLNDVFTFVGGYETERQTHFGRGVDLNLESAVIGGERVIKNPLGEWQHNISLRYRLDRLNSQGGDFSSSVIPQAFREVGANTEQTSLLFGYEISKTLTEQQINPTKGFKQTYKIQAGSQSLLSETDMAIVSSAWRFIYSLGEHADHQFMGRADLGYIFTQQFSKVPYNLRFFTGGDQTIRGFDYKSLGPEKDGFLVGGQALAVGSLEYNYQFKEGWRAAVFADAGNAYDKDFKTPTAYGAGLGIRWKSPIGPIRFDIASGLSDPNHPVRIHFFIGSPL